MRYDRNLLPMLDLIRQSISPPSQSVQSQAASKPFPSMQYDDQGLQEIARRAATLGIAPNVLAQQLWRPIMGRSAGRAAGLAYRNGVPGETASAPDGGSEPGGYDPTVASLVDGTPRPMGSVPIDPTSTASNAGGSAADPNYRALQERWLERYLQGSADALQSSPPARPKTGFRTQDLLLGLLPALFMGKQGGDYVASYLQGKMAGDQQKYGDMVGQAADQEKRKMGLASLDLTRANYYGSLEQAEQAAKALRTKVEADARQSALDRQSRESIAKMNNEGRFNSAQSTALNKAMEEDRKIFLDPTKGTEAQMAAARRVYELSDGKIDWGTPPTTSPELAKLQADISGREVDTDAKKQKMEFDKAMEPFRKRFEEAKASSQEGRAKYENKRWYPKSEIEALKQKQATGSGMVSGTAMFNQEMRDRDDRREFRREISAANRIIEGLTSDLEEEKKNAPAGKYGEDVKAYEKRIADLQKQLDAEKKTKVRAEEALAQLDTVERGNGSTKTQTGNDGNVRVGAKVLGQTVRSGEEPEFQKALDAIASGAPEKLVRERLVKRLKDVLRKGG